MKTFRYEKGHVCGETLTVGEMRSLLYYYPEDMPMIATWEGTLNFFTENSMRILTVSKGFKEDECECLVIDVNIEG